MRFSRLGCVLLPLFLLLILLLWGGLKARRMLSVVQSLQGHQGRAEQILQTGEGISGVNPAAVELLISDIRADVVELDGEARPFLWMTPYLGWLPEVGPLMGDAPDLLELADAGTLAAFELRGTLSEALTVLQGSGQEENTLGALTTLLANSETQLAGVEDELERITVAYEGVENPEALPYQVEALWPTVDQFLPLADDGLQFAKVLPQLLGTEGQKTYLILAQNEDELRATGGYISGAGLMLIENGDILALQFISADQVNPFGIQGDPYKYLNELYDLPPEPLQTHMGLDYFLFRDANHWPDFEKSAETAITLYRLGQPDSPEIDGVIAIDQQFVSAIVGAMGNLELPNLGITVNSESVRTEIQQVWSVPEGEEVTGEWWRNRKSFMGDLAQAAQDRLLGDPGSVDLTALLSAIVESGNSKDIQIYMRDDSVQTIIDDLGWGGKFDAPDHDFLFVLDSNFGFSKTNFAMNRSYKYTVDLTQTPAAAKLAVTYQHTSPSVSEPCQHITPYQGFIDYQILVDQCYYNYLRVYAPPQSQLEAATNHTIPADWLVTSTDWNNSAKVFTDTVSYSGFDTFFTVRQGETLTTEMQYRPVQTETKDGYALTLFKQAGMASHPVRVTVTLPTTASPQPNIDPVAVNGSTYTFDINLNQDTTLTIDY